MVPLQGNSLLVIMCDVGSKHTRFIVGYIAMAKTRKIMKKNGK